MFGALVWKLVLAPDDGTVFDFTLRVGVMFHDGTAFDAEAVKFSLERTKELLRDYLDQTGAKVSGVCVAAAGPVQDGVAEMTNLSWVIDATQLTRATGAGQTAILNDLQAQGHALGHIAPEKLRVVIDGPQKAGASMLVVGLGTGVNAAPVHGSGAARVVPPSECGHVNMPVRSEEDLRLLRFIETRLQARHETPHCGVEEVLAGRGLANLHAFASLEAGHPAECTSAEVLAALEQGDPTATHAARLYTRINKSSV